jgi:hypothetical protein
VLPVASPKPQEQIVLETGLTCEYDENFVRPPYISGFSTKDKQVSTNSAPLSFTLLFSILSHVFYIYRPPLLYPSLSPSLRHLSLITFMQLLIKLENVRATTKVVITPKYFVPEFGIFS